MKEVSIYERKLQIKDELKEIEEIYLVFSSDSLLISYQRKLILQKRIDEYMKLIKPEIEKLKLKNKLCVQN